MNTLLTRVFALALLITGVSAAMSQESPLGSPAEVRGKYGTNYADVVRAALPKADVAMLNRVLASIRTAAAAEKPLAITNPRQLERMFGLRERAEADASDATGSAKGGPPFTKST